MGIRALLTIVHRTTLSVARSLGRVQGSPDLSDAGQTLARELEGAAADAATALKTYLDDLDR